MLEFFRRYQRAFFVCITIVIVISFSFFGTFQTMVGNQKEDKVAFTAVTGQPVLHSELSDMINFLMTDMHDQLVSGFPWAGNGANDGVIVNDVLSTGLAEVITTPYLPELGSEMQTRLEREKRYTAYKHPRAPFLSSELVWSYYAPQLKANFDRLRASADAKSEDAFSARTALYLAERQFPSAYLKQILRYQESSYKWLPQDPSLAQRDLSLFGYHNIQDWFGRGFIELVAQFIINSAKVAEKQGYVVNKEEALGSLFRNIESTYVESGGAKALGISTPADYFQEQMRRLGMDQARAVRVWTSVLLFRRLFFENAESILVSPLPYRDFYHHLSEYVDIDLYQLPKEFQFASNQQLQQFSLYLNAVTGASKTNLQLPQSFLSPEQVKKTHPELVERAYRLRWAVVNKEQLQTKIGVRQMWQWQVADNNWEKLTKQFPEMIKADKKSADERLSLLDSLDAISRSRVDSYSREQIVNEHPEWIGESFEEADWKEEEVPLREQGGKTPFDGLTNTFELIQLLDKAPLNEQDPQLADYTQDGVFHYRILLLEKAPNEKILTFKEAQSDGTLATMVDKTLQATYSRIQLKEPSTLLKENGDVKSFAEAKGQITTLCFEPLMNALDAEIEKEKKLSPKYVDWSDKEEARLAVLFLPYVREAQKLRQQGADMDSYLQSETVATSATASQWKLNKTRTRVARKDSTFPVDPQIAFSLDNKAVSPTCQYAKSGPAFFVVEEKGFLPANDLIREKVLDERELLAHAAICELGQKLLADMKEHGSIQLQEGGTE